MFSRAGSIISISKLAIYDSSHNPTLYPTQSVPDSIRTRLTLYPTHSVTDSLRTRASDAAEQNSDEVDGLSGGDSEGESRAFSSAAEENAASEEDLLAILGAGNVAAVRRPEGKPFAFVEFHSTVP